MTLCVIRTTRARPMVVEVHGKPNYQRLAETWLSILAARDGLDVVPGSVKVELKGEQDDDTDETDDR